MVVQKRGICQIGSHSSKVPKIISTESITLLTGITGQILGYSCMVHCKLITLGIDTYIKQHYTLFLVFNGHHK